MTQDYYSEPIQDELEGRGFELLMNEPAIALLESIDRQDAPLWDYYYVKRDNEGNPIEVWAGWSCDFEAFLLYRQSEELNERYGN